MTGDVTKASIEERHECGSAQMAPEVAFVGVIGCVNKRLDGHRCVNRNGIRRYRGRVHIGNG
jgi:hypothetical protein